MLPRLEMSRDECRKCLRCLELDAYSNMVSVLRAQGPFTVDKKKLLQELASVLHISNERHRAEIRRAVNDDKLSVIAKQLNGPNTGIDWAIEGRRTIPLLPRLKAHNAFTALANSLSIVTTIANEKEPPEVKKPVQTNDIQSKTMLSAVNADVPGSRKRKKPSVDAADNYIPYKKAAIKTSVSANVEAVLSPTPTTNKVLLPPSASVVEVQKQNERTIPVTSTNKTASSVQSVIPPTLVCNNTKIQIQKSSTNTTVPTNVLNAVKREHATAMRKKSAQNVSTDNGFDTDIKDTSSNTEKGLKLVSAANKIHKVSLSDLNSNTECVTTHTSKIDSNTSTTPKCIPQSSAPQTLTTNSTCFTSCGPGPPSNEATKLTTTIIRNKFSSFNINTLPANKMGRTNLGTKGNFIVLKKAPLRDITLSHSGKEVVGKLIMGKNLRLSNQQNANSITVMPRCIGQISNCNGEQNALDSSTNTVCAKINNVTVNTSSDSEEKKTAQFDQESTNFDVNFQAALVNQTECDTLQQDKINECNNPLSLTENNLQSKLNTEENKMQEDDLNSSENKTKNDVSNNDNKNQVSATIVEGFLDPQTGIYSIQLATDNTNKIESVESTSTKILEHELDPTKLNAEKYTLIKTEENNAVINTSEKAMLIIDQVDSIEMCDS